MTNKIILITFLAIAGFFLIAENRAHVNGALVYVLLFLCVIMHFFHSGHGGKKRGHH